MVTNLLEANLLVILTDQPGLFTGDPRRNPSATLLSEVSANDPGIVAMAGGAGSNIGTGGMATKVQAARRASHSGAHTVIASGHEPDVLLRLAALEPIGSLLLADVPMRSARQQWLADHLQLRAICHWMLVRPMCSCAAESRYCRLAWCRWVGSSSVVMWWPA